MRQLSFGDDPGHRWRGAAGLLTPYRQWVRENLPTSAQRFVLCGDDGFIRRWTDADSLGWVRPIEVKTFKRKPMDYATTMAFRALCAGRVRPPFAINLVQGNVPSLLRDWPEPCPRCGLPEPAVEAQIIYLNGRAVTAPVLVERLLDVVPDA